jgi:hypothetical protein
MKKTQGIDADELNLVKLAQEYSDEDINSMFSKSQWSVESQV